MRDFYIKWAYEYYGQVRKIHGVIQKYSLKIQSLPSDSPKKKQLILQRREYKRIEKELTEIAEHLLYRAEKM